MQKVKKDQRFRVVQVSNKQSMGCSASDLDQKEKLISTENYSWSEARFNDAYIGGKKYIFYKTKHHKRNILLQSWLRRLDISVYIDIESEDVDKPYLNVAIRDNQALINMIVSYIKYETEYENEGNKNESLIVETNSIVVLPSNGQRIYEFKSLHIQPFGILTVTKWIDCDYHNNIGGVLKIHCHENITIDKNGQINLNGAGLTGLEDNDILTKYGGWNTNKYHQTKDIEQDEKAIELKKIDETIYKPNLYKFDNYYLAKGGSYFKVNNKKNKNKIYFGGIGGGSISLRCNNFKNNGYVLANCTNKPNKFSKATNDRKMLSKLQYFANNGNHKYKSNKLKVVDLGTDGTGGFISIHIYNNFINHGLIQAMKFGDINIVQLDGGDNIDPDRKLIFGEFRKNIDPFPKAQGKELKQIPTDELL